MKHLLHLILVQVELKTKMELIANTAFLREVIEERYVSGFGMHMPFNDARRLRKSDSAYSVPFVISWWTKPTIIQKECRMLLQN